MKNYIVTGAAGFIGSHVTQRLLEMGMTVFAIDNFCDFYNPAIKWKNVDEISKKVTGEGSFHLFEGDIRDKEFLNAVIKDVGEVNGDDADSTMIHIAAMAGVRPSLENPSLYEEVNMGGTLNLLNLCKNSGINKFLFASSSSIYGNNKKVPFSEDDPVDHPISIYAATKKAGELLCNVYSHLYGIKTICLRFFTVYGARQRPDLAIHKFTDLITKGLPIPLFGDGTSRRDYTYIDDIMDGTFKAIERLENQDFEVNFEVYNLGESRTVELSHLVKLIETETGKKAVIKSKPMQPGDVNITFADISRARKILGYSPQTAIEDGIKSFVKWYRREKGI